MALTSRVSPDHAPLRAGTRGSPLALVQTRLFIELLCAAWPTLKETSGIEEYVVRTTGDRVQDRPLAEIGGKGLFSKEIHEALSDGRVDFAVHSLKDLESELPPGIVLACTLAREDARDALILSPGTPVPDGSAPFACLPAGAVIGTSSVRRQAQLLHARPDLNIRPLRGNVETRLSKVAAQECFASVLAMAGLNRLGLSPEASIALDPDIMVPAVAQGIIGITVRERDVASREMLAAIDNPEAKAASSAERAMLAELDGSCRTPIGGHARVLPNGELLLTGVVARPDGSFLLQRSLRGSVADAARTGADLGAGLRADCPRDIFG